MASSPASNNKSSLSSSPPIPSRPNPKPRNSETGDLMRRSFRANPFPADLPRRRNSMGGGDKENQIDNDQIPNPLKAPKNGAKNFMSPTISAVSKINPSPRKKILSDRNQVSRSFDNKTNHHQVRSSVSFSDVVSIIGKEEDKDRDQIWVDDEKNQLVDDDVTVTDFEENLGDFDDSRFFNVSHHLPPSVPYESSPVFVAQEVDPSVAPYDPKKNYLSPRPQFLHYRPNPRIEHRSDDCKELFISESSSSDIDLSAEESQEEEEVASQEGEVAVEEEEEAEVIQDVDDEDHLEAEESDEEEVLGESTEEEEETHQISKQSRCFKLLGWILAIGVAYLVLVSSVTFTQPNISQDSPFYKFHISQEFTKSARESFEQLGEKLGMWAGSSLVYMDKLISSLREEKRHGPFKFHNLTDVLEDTRLFDTVFQTSSGEISVAELLVDRKEWNLEMDIEEENVDHQERENNGGELGFEVEEDGSEFEHTEIKMATDGGEGYSESLSEEESGGQETDGVEEHREYGEVDQKNLEESQESETISAQDDEKSIEESESDTHQLDNVESATISSHQQEETREVANPETVPEEENMGEAAGNTFDISAETIDVDGNDLEGDNEIGEAVNAEGWEEGDSRILLSDQKKVVALISTVMVLLASAAAFFFLAKKKAKPVKMMMTHEDDKPTTISDTKKVESEQAVSVENLVKERLSSLNFQEEVEEVDDDREREVSSLPSEVSFSFHKNKSLHSCNNNKDDLKDYQSGGRGGGRKSNDSSESMASSASEYSIGSVSFGSFTTYEKIQKKSGRKEEEIVTPVRRSSRIRNHQHSGQ